MLTIEQQENIDNLKLDLDIPQSRIQSLIERFENENRIAKITCDKHGNKSINKTSGICMHCESERLSLESIKQNILKAKLNAEVPPRYKDACFENFTTTNESEINVTKIKNASIDQNMLLLGTTGTGKTHLAFSIIDKILQIDSNAKCKYIQYYKLTDLKIKHNDKYEDILNADFLAIDEYGVQDTDFKSSLLFEIINHRYNFLLPTLIISNLNLVNFKESISDALYSRFKENYMILLCKWNDYRLKATNETTN